MNPELLGLGAGVFRALVNELGPEWVAREVARLFTSKSALDAVLESEYAAIEKAAELAEKKAFG